jgi:preprotein translocase subunit YajC
MYVIFGVMFVGLIVMTVIPQRKQKKKQAEMMSSIGAGDKIMTIGGLVGTIKEVVEGADRYIIDCGTEEVPNLITIVKQAIRTKL